MEGELLLNISQIAPILEALLGRSSRWNGQVRLESGLFFAGAVRYDGSISVSEIIFADQDLRWRTLIHEVLHTLLAGKKESWSRCSAFFARWCLMRFKHGFLRRA